MRKRVEEWQKVFGLKKDWIVYNEELVLRGEYYLDLSWVQSWDEELREMNEGKKGRPYKFPESLIELQAMWHQFLDYRGVEGVTRKLVELAGLPAYNDYTTISRRVKQLSMSFEVSSKRVHAAADGSGMKLGNCGVYLKEKYKKKKNKFIKVKILADPFTKDLLACEASVEGEGDSEPKTAERQVENLLEQGVDVVKFFGDAAYDTISLFDLLELFNIEAAIKPRTLQASNDPKSAARKKAVDECKEKGYDLWRKEKQYGMRWPGTEGIFSAVKRKFGENTRALKPPNKLKEVERKFWCYHRLTKYGQSQVRKGGEKSILCNMASRVYSRT